MTFRPSDIPKVTCMDKLFGICVSIYRKEHESQGTLYTDPVEAHPAKTLYVFSRTLMVRPITNNLQPFLGCGIITHLLIFLLYSPRYL